MEASQSGFTINNSNNIVLTVDLAIQFALGIAGVGSIIGVLITLVGKLGAGRIKELYAKRERDWLKRQQAAQDITSFCIEGMHSGFRHKAGSERAIKFRAAEIESIDTSVGIKLGEFLGAWSMYRNFIKDKPIECQNDALAIEYNRKAQKLAEELLEITKIWAR